MVSDRVPDEIRAWRAGQPRNSVLVYSFIKRTKMIADRVEAAGAVH